MTKIDLTTDIKPICPHCEKEINSLYFVKLGEITISGEGVYYCEHCKKILQVKG